MIAGRTVRLRPAGEGDAELLYEIYASTRQEELAPVPWDAATKEAFLRMQFAAQDRHYRMVYPDASYDLVVEDEMVLGRLSLNRGPQKWLIIDIALLPEHRGQGLGTQLLRQVLAEADVTGKAVQIHVEQLNRARRLYERLGFREIEDQGVYLLLEHQARSG